MGITIKNSFNAGDLITALPGLQKLYSQNGTKVTVYQRVDFPARYYEGAYSPIRNAEGDQVSMNEEMFCKLKPLLESQPYIENFQKWEGQPVDIDLDETRHCRIIPMPAGLLHHWVFAKFPELSCDLSVPWLKVAQHSIVKERFANKVIINRTHRYTNPYISYYFLKEYKDQLLFSGTEEEHQTFCKQFNLDIEYLKVDDFLQLAQIISWCKGGIYNQSFHWHLADALKCHRILELCSPFPNTFPTGANGYAFYHQKSVEYFVHQLMNS